MTPKSFRDIEPAPRLSFTRHGQRIPKRDRNHREEKTVTPKHHEVTPKHSERNAESHSEEPRRAENHYLARGSGIDKNTKSPLRDGTSRYPEEVPEIFRAIRKRFGHTPRTLFVVTSG